MLAATLRRAGACRHVTAFVSQARSRSAFPRIAALRRRAPASSSPMAKTTTSAAMAAAASSSSSSSASQAPAALSASTPKQQHRRFPPLAPGSVAPEEYEARLEEKVERVRSILAGVLPRSGRREGEAAGEGEGERGEPPFPLEVFASPARGFRLRAEFRVWHDGGDLYYVMFDTRDPSVKPPPKVRIDHFPVGPPMMNALMEETLAACREDKGEGDDDDDGGGEEGAAAEAAAQEEEEEEEEDGGGEEQGEASASTPRRRWLRRRKHPKSRGGPLRRKLFQANFHTTLGGECLVTLIYHRNLGGEAEGAAWEAAARGLRQRLLRAASGFGCRSVDVIGRSRGVARVVEKDHVQEVLEVEFGGRKKRGGGGGGEQEQEREEGEGAAAEPSPPSSSPPSPSPAPRRRSLRYRQTEGSFSQPNGRVCESMLGWAWKAALGSGSRSSEGSPARAPRRRSDDLLELYCGNGNFTAALAPAFRRVVATEVSRSGVASAVINLKENSGGGEGEGEGEDGGDDDDVVVARADADRVAAALAALDNKREGGGGGGGGGTVTAAVAEPADKDGEINATGEAQAEAEAEADDVFAGVVPTSLGGNADLSTYDLRTLFVDPPRAGVGAATGRILGRFDRVLYVSCNPESLAADVAALVGRGGGGGDDGGEGCAFGGSGTHEVTAAAVFDQFPYTDHIECGLLLERKKERKN